MKIKDILWYRRQLNRFPVVKEIRGKLGMLHFKRWAIFESTLLNVYVHYIGRSDEDAHPHDHPFNFWTYILKGGYSERVYHPDEPMSKAKTFSRKRGTLSYHPSTTAHKISLFSRTWTVVLTGPRNRVWGYRVADDKWVDFETYRDMKRRGLLTKEK